MERLECGVGYAGAKLMLPTCGTASSPVIERMYREITIGANDQAQSVHVLAAEARKGTGNVRRFWPRAGNCVGGEV